MAGDGTRTVLVLDDDAAARRMMRKALERRGYAVSEAGDGAAALELIREQRPDVALLDLRMPGELSGLDVIARVRATPGIAATPLIVVSASVHSDIQTITRESGADGFVEKPVDFDLLQTAIESVLG